MTIHGDGCFHEAEGTRCFPLFVFLGRPDGKDETGAGASEKLLIEGRVKENHAIIETYPSSHNHGSGKWVPPILVSFYLG